MLPAPSFPLQAPVVQQGEQADRLAQAPTGDEIWALLGEERSLCSVSADGSDCIERLLRETLDAASHEPYLLAVTPERHAQAMFWKGGEALMGAARAAGTLGLFLRSQNNLSHSARGWVSLALLFPAELAEELEHNLCVRHSPHLRRNQEALRVWARERARMQAPLLTQENQEALSAKDSVALLESLENLSLAIFLPIPLLEARWTAGFAAYEHVKMQDSLRNDSLKRQERSDLIQSQQNSSTERVIETDPTIQEGARRL